MLPFDDMNVKMWNLEGDIFISGSALKVISESQSNSLIDIGLKVVAYGANIAFIDDDVFFGLAEIRIDK